jgi:hypothetical protein
MGRFFGVLVAACPLMTALAAALAGGPILGGGAEPGKRERDLAAGAPGRLR